jgi:ABC-2 type transport system permease protein
MTPAPGSTLWLLRHEIKLQWRTTGQKVNNVRVVIAIALFVAQGIAFMMAFGANLLPPMPANLLLLMMSSGALIVFLLMVSTALAAVVQTLYTRGDMDLMLSSPLAPRSIVLVRASAVAVNVCARFGLLILPFANAFGLLVNPRWFVAYLALSCLGMLATAVSLMTALGLFRTLGPRRTRQFAQIFAALIGMAAVVLAQLPNVMNPGPDGIMHQMDNLLAVIAVHGSDSWIWLPARALRGDPLPLVALLALCVGIFALVAHCLADRFLATMVAAGGTGTTSGQNRRKASSRRFRTGTVAVLRRKELRLIARDPWLLTQLTQKMVFVLPLGLMFWKSHIGAVSSAWLVLVLLSGNLAGGLAWLAVSGEDARELVSGAPLRSFDVLRAKIEAALLPVALALLVPIALAWRADAWLGLTLAVGCTGAAMTGVLLHALYPTEGKHSEFNRRAKEGLGMEMAELLLATGWTATAAGMLLHNPLALVGPPLLIALVTTRKLHQWLDQQPTVAMA